MKTLPPDFYLRPAQAVAEDLLGKGLQVGKLLVEITEVEAYLGEDDPASHAYRGKTARNWPMFEAGGTCYVYFTYGMHYCMNVSTGPEGLGHAVLFRAAKPLEGIDAMIRNRGGRPERQLLSGPAKLTQALGIDLGYNGKRFDRRGLRLVDLGNRIPSRDVARGPRIGISKAKDAPLRFCIRSSPWLSRVRITV